MAAPSLAARNAFFVNYVGTDDPGYNAIGAPWSYRSVTAALAALALVANTPSATNPWVIAIGPGVFTEPGLQLPPWVWIVGSPDGEGGSSTKIVLSGGNLTLSAGWTANATARGGLSNLVIAVTAGEAIDFTVPVPSAGNPSRSLELENLTFSCAFTWEATGTADLILGNRISENGVAGVNTILFHAGTMRLHNCNFNGTITIQDTVAIACAARMTACHFNNLTFAQLGGGTVIQSDAVSLPARPNITIGGGVTLTYLSDAAGEGYTPAVPGNWPVVPVSVQQALDELAAGGAVTPGNGYAAANNNAGNATVTPTAHNYFLALTVGGVARTSVEILDIATPPAAGDRIAIGCTLPATPAITLEFRNATVGGTLIYSINTDGATLSALFEFVYTGAAWVAAGYQVPYQT